MTKEIRYCDRCGAEIKEHPARPYWIKPRKFRLFKVSSSIVAYEDELDLCQRCCDSLKEWVNKGGEGE